ncbi:unnamed protein product [Cyclocybe aegerita]|uniref:WD40 repeat-like protein n=1 Tax=Cyclocybe aegerita TaxID=1973307 RepID=A0A8S0VUW0_CYCAE|nr:unnamed protein product [Cyclocybe aegerita]
MLAMLWHSNKAITDDLGLLNKNIHIAGQRQTFMFAVTTTDTLSVADPALLKKAPSSIPSCLDLVEAPTASAWSPDNSFLYISSARTIHRYDPTTNILRDVYSLEEVEEILHIAVKDRTTIILAAGSTIHVLECGSSPEIIQTFDSHKSPITSLSLSNDNTLLASTSSGTAHVHNLALGSHTVLKGLNGQDVGTAVFNPHSRTRLLVSSRKQLLVYDTTRPSGPVKTVTLADSCTRDITSVACSPFSKTLTAVATPDGFVGLIDLDKEKALFRMLPVKHPLTRIVFSPEGGCIYLGTEHGSLLLVDLRGLDKPPKPIIVSETGNRVQTISIQKKTKSPADPATRASITTSTSTTMKTATEAPLPARRATSNTATQAAKPVPKVAPSPARPRVGKATVVAPSPIARRVASSVKGGTPASPVPLRSAKAASEKKVLSPVRDPLGNSGDVGGQLDQLAKLHRGKPDSTPLKSSKRPSADAVQPVPSSSRRATATSASKLESTKSSSLASTTTATEASQPRRARTLPSSSSSTLATRKSSTIASITESVSTTDRLAVPNPKGSPVRRQRTTSSASRASAVDVISSASTARNGAGSGTKAETTRRVSGATSATSVSVVSPTSPSRPSSTTSASAVSRSGSGSGSGSGSMASRRSKVSSSLGHELNEEPENEVVTARKLANRTPSPDFPDVHVEPVTPVPVQKLRQKESAKAELKEAEGEKVQDGEKGKGKDKDKKRGMGVLGLGTPEVERWVQAGKAGASADLKSNPSAKEAQRKESTSKGKSVGFKDAFTSDDEEEREKVLERERERNLSLQISPRRPGGLPPSGSDSGVSASSWNAALSSALSSASSPAPSSTSADHTDYVGAATTAPPTNTSAHELLKTIIEDVMFDFQRETKAEMMGLHLDLLRMGRGWKNELRVLMDEYVGDLRELREENQRLRVENERLRRGTY